LHGATAAVTSVAFGLCGRVLAEGSADHRVRLFNLASGIPVPTATLAGLARPVTGVAFSGGPQVNGGTAGAGRLSGELAASSADGTVSLWKVGYQAVTHPVAAGKDKAGKPQYRTITTASVAATAAGTLATGTASSGPAGSAPASTAPAGSGAASGVAFSPDGREVAVAAGPAGVQVWTVASRALAARIPASQAVTAVAWDGDGDGRVAAAGADGSVTIWSLPTPQLPAANKTSVVAYRPDGKVIAAGGTSVELWNVASGTLLVSRPTGGVTGLAFSPDSTLVAAALADGTVELMSAATLVAAGPPLRAASAPGGAAESVAFSPDGKTLAAAADDGIVRFWSLADPARPALVAKVRDAAVAARTLAYSPDGATLAVASADDAVTLWNVRDPAAPTREGRLAGLTELATGLAFTRDSRLLAAGSADRTVRLWNVGDPASAVAVGSPLAGPSGSVRAVAVSPDGSMLAIGSADGSAWLWNIATAAAPVLIGTLTGPAGQVDSVAFSPSGAQLTAASTDGTLFTWDTSAAAARTAACASIGQPLTAAQWAAYAPGVPYKAPCS
jgi:WD40 repeat protein